MLKWRLNALYLFPKRKNLFNGYRKHPLLGYHPGDKGHCHGVFLLFRWKQIMNKSGKSQMKTASLASTRRSVCWCSYVSVRT
jgi:hypothetical protein